MKEGHKKILDSLREHGRIDEWTYGYMKAAASYNLSWYVTQHPPEIEGFEDGQRSYGRAKCFKTIINDEVEGAIIIIERTHYDDTVLEIIAPINIRKKLGLNEGDIVEVDVIL